MRRTSLSARGSWLLTGLLLSGMPVLHAADPADPASIDEILLQVLAGDLSGALHAVEALRETSRDDTLDQLSVELSDLNRGDYATTGNRAFPALKPLWQRARAQWLASRPQPDGVLPPLVLSLPDTVRRLLLVDAQQSAAWLMQRAADGEHWQTLSGYYVSIGANGVDKRHRGDRRTPVGVYYLVDQLDTGRLPSRYGSHVLTLDYPNSLDVSQGRNGDGIWLHGIDPDNNIRPPRDTDGCIAFDNLRMAELIEQLSLYDTPVIIADGFSWQRDRSLDDIAALLRERLETWRSAQLSGDAARLFSLYRQEFARYGLSPPMWREAERTRIGARLFTEIEIRDVEILVADEDQGIYLTRFRQALHREGRKPVTTVRRLYWQRTVDGFHIVAEQNG